jgi:hypothetical protein
MDRYGLKMLLNGIWNRDVGLCSKIRESIEEAKEMNITPNFFFDARNLNYEFGNDILCLVVIPKTIYGKLVPVTIYATDEHIQDENVKARYGWNGIARYFRGYEASCDKKILFFDYNEALESYKSAFNKLLNQDN